MLSFVATMDKGFSRYWSVVEGHPQTDLGQKFASAMQKGIE